MGPDRSSSVVDQFGRTHDIANLFICDGSILLLKALPIWGLPSKRLRQERRTI
jgi:GMC oxidoreductase